MPRNNLFHNRHWPFGRVNRGWRHLAGQTGLVVIEEAAVLHDVAGNRIEAVSELCERNLFTAPNALDQTKIGGSQQADVLRVLPVNLFNTFSDDELNAGPLLCVGRGLSRRAAALCQA